MQTSRRNLMKAASAALAPFAITGRAAAQKGSRRDGPIVAENRKAGTTLWQLEFTEFEYPPAWQGYPLTRGLRSAAVEGFASKTSVAAGESVDFKISTDKETHVLIDIYRMGYYGGKGGRHMVRLGPFRSGPQPVPSMGLERLRECLWETTTPFTVPQGLAQRRLPRQDHPRRAVRQAELHHLRRQRPPPGGSPVPGQRSDLAGLQQVAPH